MVTEDHGDGSLILNATANAALAISETDRDRAREIVDGLLAGTARARSTVARRFPQMVAAELVDANQVALAMSRDCRKVQMDLARNLGQLNEVDGRLAINVATFLTSSSEWVVRTVVAEQLGGLYSSHPLAAASLFRRLALDPFSALAIADQLPQLAHHDRGLVHEIVSTLDKAHGEGPQKPFGKGNFPNPFVAHAQRVLRAAGCTGQNGREAGDRSQVL